MPPTPRGCVWGHPYCGCTSAVGLMELLWTLKSVLGKTMSLLPASGSHRAAG